MKGPPQKQRYNAKARQSTAGGSSHKKRRGNVPSSSQDIAAQAFERPDSNREVIDPSSQAEQDWKAQESQRRKLLAASQSEDPEQRLSSKKRKRLDAYIASRLKKEARAELLEELSKSTEQVREGRQDFVSARTLGTGKGRSARELIEGKSRSAPADEEDSSGEEDGEGFTDLEADAGPSAQSGPSLAEQRPTGELLDDPLRRQRIMEAAALFAPSKPADPVTKGPTTGSALSHGSNGFGSALARGTDGQPVMPAMRKRVRKGPSQTQRRQLRRQAQEDAADASEDSFDSSDSSSSDDAASDSDEEAGRADKDSLKSPVTIQVTQRNATTAAKNLADADARASRHDLSDRDTDSEEEAVIMEAMRRRGIEPVSEDDSDSASDTESRSQQVASTSKRKTLGLDDLSDGDTDSEGEAILMEAMRRRGLPLPSEDEGSDDDDDAPQPSNAHIADESREASRELGLAPGADSLGTSDAESLPWDGFESTEEGSAGSASEAESSADDVEEPGSGSGSGSGGGSEAEGQELSADDAVASRRRGIQRTDRSSGFKDWARAALGFGATDAQGGVEGRTEAGSSLEPIAGLSVKVSEMGPADGIAHGPLGEREASPSALSPFAAKSYSEIASSKAIRNVPVQRTQEVTEGRLRLPVVQEEERVVKTILENEVTVICGETGSGKTTQVAQMLFERGFGTPGSDNPGLVGITQPRRVAAVSTARRVAEELNLGSNRVSHQIRYDGTVSPQTSLKFMTDGVLLRALAGDLLLSQYSVVIVDEAHERSVNTDVVIGMLSRVVRLRASRWIAGMEGAKPLRLVIMSATLRVADFVENSVLFPSPPPLLKIEARQHPVTVHFNRRTSHDYIGEAVKKASKIHERLPPGGILIFMTGEQEIRTICKELEAKFGQRAIQRQRSRRQQQHKQWQRREASHLNDEEADEDSDVRMRVRPDQEDVEAEDLTLGPSSDLTQLEGVDDQSKEAMKDAEALDTESEDEGGESDASLPDDAPGTVTEGVAAPMHVLPLYSSLPSEKQLQVFNPPPEDARLVVVATNVAETSLTIPNVRYVIDCGRSKQRNYDKASGISSFKVDWISKASASQRAGRAGRTGPGHCYRLYSSNVFEEYFDEFAEAEIRRTPVEALVLQMKSMNIDNVIHFPFPTPPERQSIAKAERVLTRLGALSAETDQKSRLPVARITELGKTMALFPLNPRFAKMLVQGQQHQSLPYVVALVAALSVGELFVRDEGESGNAQTEEMTAEQDVTDAPELQYLDSQALRAKEERKLRRRRRFAALDRFDSLGGPGISDAFRVLAVVGAHAYAGGSLDFCKENFLRPKAMEELRQLRRQLSTLVLSTLSPSAETDSLAAALSSPKLPPPSATQLKVVRQLLACAYIDQVAVRADLVPEASRAVPALAQMAAEGRLAGSKWRTGRHVPYLAMGAQGEAAYIHQSSALFEHAPPEWCVFSELSRSKPKIRPADEDAVDEVFEEQRGRVFLKGLTAINPNWIAKLGKDMCSFSKPEPLDRQGGSSLAATIAALKKSSGAGPTTSEQQVVMTPTYGTGPACEPSERAGHIGWELPPVKATRRWVGGSQGWTVDL
ncbi:unnamed protein product [Parajaminaea phylloscopi]